MSPYPVTLKLSHYYGDTLVHTWFATPPQNGDPPPPPQCPRVNFCTMVLIKCCLSQIIVCFCYKYYITKYKNSMCCIANIFLFLFWRIFSPLCSLTHIIHLWSLTSKIDVSAFKHLLASLWHKFYQIKTACVQWTLYLHVLQVKVQVRVKGQKSKEMNALKSFL